MKKTYVIPFTKVFKVTLTHNIAVSGTSIHFSNDNESASQVLTNETAGSDVFSKQENTSLWEE